MQKLSAVTNKDKKRNEAATYLPDALEADGKTVWCMLTAAQLRVAKQRADRNPEDIPESSDSLLGKLFGWMID